MERLEHVAGSQGPQGKQGTNTQEIERDRSADQVRDELATVKAKAEAADQAHQEQRKTAAQEAHRVAEKLAKAQGDRDQARTDAATTREELAKIRGQLEASEAYKAELLGMLNKGTQAQTKTAPAAKKGA